MSILLTGMRPLLLFHDSRECGDRLLDGLAPFTLPHQQQRATSRTRHPLFERREGVRRVRAAQDAGPSDEVDLARLTHVAEARVIRRAAVSRRQGMSMSLVVTTGAHKHTFRRPGTSAGRLARVPQAWPRLCRAVKAIHGPEAAPPEVSQSPEASTGNPPNPVLPRWVSETVRNGRAGESNPPTAPLSTIHRF
jgi:hypothetical protein